LHDLGVLLDCGPSALEVTVSNVLSRAAVVAALSLSVLACSEHADVALTPAQQKKVEAAFVTAPTPQIKVDAVVDGQVRLIGYDIDKTELAPGETFTISYYVEALADTMGDNNVFVHLQGRKNDAKAWMNLDHALVEGLLPLRKLKKGQVVKDTQRVTVRPDFPGGEAHIYWGLFRADQRLKISNADALGKDRVDAEGRVIVAKLMLRGAAVQPVLPEASAQRLGAGEVLTIDGKGDEPAWARAAWTPAFVPPNGKGGDAPATRARFLWDDSALYVHVECEDTDVWSDFTVRDSNTWEQEVVEVFIDADGDRKDYLELQVTPANVIFDARFAAYRKDLETARQWNMAGLRTGAFVDGTLNARDDQDRRWSVELAIPFAEVPPLVAAPRNGDVWRVNLFRWDAPKGDRQIAAAFSPPVVPDFHALDKFGRLRFVDPAAPAPTSAPEVRPTAPVPPPSGASSVPPSAPLTGAGR